MNDNFILTVEDKTIFNSKWLESDDPNYINSQTKIIRNPNPPEYFISTLPKNFVAVGFAEMGFDNIVIWLKKVFQDDIILPVNMSELLYKGKSDILLNLNNMQWSEIIENSQRCIILDIWAEAIQIATKDINSIVLNDWVFFISSDFYSTFKKEFFSSEGIDHWHLFKCVKNWYQNNNQSKLSN